jgi:enoyl-CoA hydratase
MEYKNILFEVEDNIATVTFNRPKALNALNSELISEFYDAMTRCDTDESIKVVILTGAGDKAFVAGADIAEMRDMTPKDAIAYLEPMHNTLRLVENIGKPTIAAVNGFALGGGTETAMACDVRFASDKARFGQPEISLGIIPGFGGTKRLARLIGMGRAKELIISGELITAQRAYEIGLVNRVFPADTLMEETRKFAQKLAGLPSFAMRMIEYAINHNYESTVDEAGVLEVQCAAQCFSTQDLHEGMTAFLEKRKPKFIGK